MPQGIVDFWDNNTGAIVLLLIGAVSSAVAAVALQKTTGAVGRAAGWLWRKRPFRRQPSLLRDPTLTIEETFDRQLEALQQQLDSAQTDEEKTPIRLEIGQVAEAKAAYYRASRELSLPPSVRERMEALADRRGTIAEARIPQELPRDPEELSGLYQRMRQDLLQAVAGLREYTLALEQRPDDAAALAARATGLSLSGRYEEALPDLNRSLDQRPDDPATLYNRGITLDDLERYEEALADYSRSLDLRPDNPATLNNRGVTLNHLERYEGALADYNRSLDLRHDDPATLNNRGNTLSHLERYDEALADYNRSLDLRPDYPATLYNVACLLSLTGRYEESLSWLDRSIIGDSKNSQLANEDEDFASLRNHPEFGPRFHQLVTGNSGDANH